MPRRGRSSAQEKEIEVAKKVRQIKRNNKMVSRINEANDLIAEDFMDEFEDYVKKKKEEFSVQLNEYIENHKEELQDTALAKRLSTSSLQNYLCQPFIKSIIHIDGKKYNAKHLMLASDYYWEKVAEMRDNHIDYIPTFQQFARLLNISVQSLRKNYLNCEDEEMRETIEMIRDRFVDFYTENGMKRQISEVMSIFMLKSEYNIRDNDVPQTIINNNNFTLGSGNLLKELQEEEKTSDSLQLLSKI